MHFTTASENSSNSTKCVPQCLDVEVWTPEVHESIPAYWGPRNSFKTFVINWPAVRIGVVRAVRVRGETPKAEGSIYLNSLSHPWPPTSQYFFRPLIPPHPLWAPPTPDHLLTPDRPHPPTPDPTPSPPKPHIVTLLHPLTPDFPFLWFDLDQWPQVKQSEVL